MGKIADIDGELERDGKIQKVKLRALLKPITTEEGTVFVRNIIDKLGLAPGQHVEDGNYMLRYVFDGKKEEGKHRVKNGQLLAGWVSGASR